MHNAQCAVAWRAEKLLVTFSEGSGCFSTSVGVSGEYSIGSSEYSVVKVNFFLWVI